MATVIIPALASLASFLIVHSLLATRKTDVVRARLQAMCGGAGALRARPAGKEEATEPVFDRILLPAMERLSRSSRLFTPAHLVHAATERLLQAGLARRVSACQYLGVCSLAGLAAIGVAYVLIGHGSAVSAPVRTALSVAAFYPGRILPMFLLARIASARRNKIRRGLPFAADLMAISMGAGQSFDAAMSVVTQRTGGPLAHEFSLTLNEMQLGRPRLDAIRDLPLRTGVDDMKAFITPIIQASKSGGSVVKTLQIQADVLRTRHKQRAQEQAQKAPVKILFPLVFFIFPAVFVVVLGPGIMRMMEAMARM